MNTTLDVYMFLLWSRTQQLQHHNKNNSDRTQLRKRQSHTKMFMLLSDLCAETRGWSEDLVMHAKLPVHTWKLRTTECPDTALFIFHASRRESTEADKGKKQTHIFTGALEPWKSADMSALNRRHSVCGAAGLLSCDSDSNDTPHWKAGQRKGQVLYKHQFVDTMNTRTFNQS